MPIIRLSGKVAPPSLKFSLLNKAPHIIWNNQSQGLQGTTELRITDGDMTATIDLNQFELERHFYTVIRQAQDLVDATLNVISFKTGIAFLGALNQITLPNGETKDCYCQEVEFPKLVTVFSRSDDLEKVMKLVFDDRNLALALRDLTDELRQAYSGPISCARAIESIRNYFVPAGGKREDGWQPMRDALNASLNYVKSITDISRDPRHGDRSKDQGDEGRKTAERAWTLMNRFLEYRKGGDQPLPSSTFPFLDVCQA